MTVSLIRTAESHTGSTGSVSQGSYQFALGQAGDAPKGVLVFTMQGVSATEVATAVSYGGSSLSPVSGGSAADTATEPGRVTAWFLGTAVPTGAQNVVVTRTNNTTVQYAVGFLIGGAADLVTYGTPVLQQENAAMTAVTINPGAETSMVFAGGYSGDNTPAPAGSTGTTTAHTLGTGTYAYSFGAGYETTPTTGSRSRGLAATSDDRAQVVLAVREYTPPPITLIGTARAFGTGTAISITHGLTLQAGDVLVATLCKNDDPNTSVSTGTYQFVEDCDLGEWTTGWAYQAVYHRVVTTPASEGTYTWTQNLNDMWTVILRQFRGVDNTNVWDLAPPTVLGAVAGQWQYADTGTTATATSRTTNYNNSLAIFQSFTDTASSDYYAAVSNGFSETYNAPQAAEFSGCCQVSAIKSIATAGAIGSTSSVLAGSNDWCCALFALRAASGATWEGSFSCDGISAVTAAATPVQAVWEGSLTCDGISSVTIVETSANTWEGSFACDGISAVTAVGAAAQAIWEASFSCEGTTSVAITAGLTHAIWEGSFACDGVTTVAAIASPAQAIWEASFTCDGVSAITAVGYKTGVTTWEGAFTCDGVSAATAVGGKTEAVWEASFTCDSISAVAIVGAKTEAVWEGSVSCEAVSAVVVSAGAIQAVWEASLTCDGVSAVTAVGGKVGVTTWEGSFTCDGISAVVVAGSKTEATWEGSFSCDGVSAVVAVAGLTQAIWEGSFTCDGVSAVAVVGAVTQATWEASFTVDATSAVTIVGGEAGVTWEGSFTCDSVSAVTVVGGLTQATWEGSFTCDGISRVVAATPLHPGRVVFVVEREGPFVLSVRLIFVVEREGPFVLPVRPIFVVKRVGLFRVPVGGREE